MKQRLEKNEIYIIRHIVVKLSNAKRNNLNNSYKKIQS